MTEIIISYRDLDERKRIFSKYAKQCHSCIARKGNIILNFINISENLIKEIENNFTVISIIRGGKNISYKERVIRGEVIEVNLTYKEGYEKGGITYGVVLQNDKGNKNSSTTIIATAKEYKKQNYKSKIHTIITVGNKKYIVELNNIQTIDYARIKNKIAVLSDKEISEIEEKLLKIIL